MGEMTLSSAVGPGAPNVPADVLLVQQLLNEQTAVTGQVLATDGQFGPDTQAAIRVFQATVVGMPAPDGIISPGGPTFGNLIAASAIAGVPALLAPQVVPSGLLRAADYATAAVTLGCDVAAIMAVASVESAGLPFDSLGRPTILYEPRVFSKRTAHVWDVSDLSDPNFGLHAYGAGSAQYPRLVRAAQLGAGGATLNVAMESASWGMFQIMGFNCGLAGFAAVADFVAAMRTGVGAHLQAFVSFIVANPEALTAIQNEDWAGFAAAYNGTGYAANGYDTKLEAAFAKASGQGA